VAAINFPNNPAVADLFTVGESSYEWDGVKWRVMSAPARVEASVVTKVAGKAGNVVLSSVDVGLGNVDNTTDANKPVSSATATALAGKQVSGSYQTAGTYASGTGSASGTNTGDQTISLTGGVTGSGVGSFAATVVTNANLTGDVTSVGNTATLANTAVTAGSYTTANITVDAQGRITAAASGSGGTNNVGYLNIPASGTKTASYTLVVGDVGKFVELGASGTVVVPAAVFAAGDAISIFNNTSATISCTCSAVTTVYKAGTDADISTFSIITRGIANILFISATVALVTGNLA
jgi:hypothetical protein